VSIRRLYFIITDAAPRAGKLEGQCKTRQSIRLARLFISKQFRSLGTLCRLLQGANAGGAKTLGNGLVPFHDLHFLDIDVPTAAGRFARPRAVVTELRAAATILTLRHDEAPLLTYNLLNWRTAEWTCGARA
jgi:hypothetical protein